MDHPKTQSPVSSLQSPAKELLSDNGNMAVDCSQGERRLAAGSSRLGVSLHT
jgi:hypothetical protein